MDWLAIARDYGPAAMSVVGAALTAVFSAIWATLMFLGKLYKKRLQKLEEHSSALCAAIRASRESVAEEHGRIKESINSYRDEVRTIKAVVEPLRSGLAHLEGAIYTQSETINDYAEKMGAVSGKLDALFQLVDAKGGT